MTRQRPQVVRLGDQTSLANITSGGHSSPSQVYRLHFIDSKTHTSFMFNSSEIRWPYLTVTEAWQKFKYSSHCCSCETMCTGERSSELGQRSLGTRKNVLVAAEGEGCRTNQVKTRTAGTESSDKELGQGKWLYSGSQQAKKMAA